MIEAIILIVILAIVGTYLVITSDDETITDEDIKKFDKWLEEEVRREQSKKTPTAKNKTTTKFLVEKKNTSKAKKPVTSKTKTNKTKTTKKISSSTKKTR